MVWVALVWEAELLFSLWVFCPVTLESHMSKGKSVAKSGKPQEERPDAWERFERAVDVALKTPPMHKEAPKAKGKKRSPKSPSVRAPK